MVTIIPGTTERHFFPGDDPIMHTKPEILLRVPCLIFLFFFVNTAVTMAAPGRVEHELSGPGWTLWLDRDADWLNEDALLPPVDLARMPFTISTLDLVGEMKSQRPESAVGKRFFEFAGGGGGERCAENGGEIH